MKKLILMGILAIVLPAVIFAQTNDEGLSLLQFSFQNPGARSLAMGGAFVGRADDATAALANPAGLTRLILPEVSLEFAANSFTNRIPYTSGNGIADDTGSGNIREISNFQYNFLPEDFPSDTQNISFASFVYPWVEQRFVLSGFFAQQADYERELDTELFLVRDRSDPTRSVTSFAATTSSLDISLRNYGLSFSYKASDRLSLGATFSVYDFAGDSSYERLDETERVFSTQTFSADDYGFSFSFGGLYNISRHFAAGAVYTRRPDFDGTAIFTNAQIQTNPIVITPQDVQFKIPDSFSVGLSFSHGFLVVDFDVARIFYSQLMDGYYNAFFQTNGVGGFVKDFESTTLEVEDGTEIRFGGEYTVPVKRGMLLAFRAGYWREPFHSVVHQVDDAQLVQIFTGGTISNDTRGKPFHSRELIQDHNHVTFGMGLILQRFQVDWAYDYSKNNTKRFVISTVLRFGAILS